MAELQNARLDELPAGGFCEPDDLVVFRSATRGVTYSLKIKDLVPSTDNNFQWQSTNEYDEDEVVTYGGLWWQSQQDVNLAHVPGTEGDDWWIAVPKAVGFGWWSAGVYTEERPMVLSDHRGQVRWYQLLSAVRPYNSIDIGAEEIEGAWEAITEQLEETPVALIPVMVLDAKFHTDTKFSIADVIDSNIEFTFDKHTFLKRFNVTFILDGSELQIKLPLSCTMNDAGWEQDAANTWTMPEFAAGETNGIWILEAEAWNDTYLVKITGPYKP